MIEIHPINEVPHALAQTHKEFNLLWYGPSTILGAYDANKHLQGVIRFAKRNHTFLSHGLVTDLQLNTENPSASQGTVPEWGKKIATALIEAAQQELLKKDVTKIDAVVIDGSKLAQHFIDNGFWASRKMVVVEWDLSTIKKPDAVEGVTLTLETAPDSAELTDFILNSYQPYWRWWKNDAFDRLWDRVDYPDVTTDQVETQNAEHNREQVRELVEEGIVEAVQGRHIFAVARKNGAIIGLCDAKLVEDEIEDCSDWGVLMQREHPGKGFGQLLLLSCLQWLKARGVHRATITTTSGLDDYDPTVYLYVQSCGGKMKGEFNNFVKRKF